MQEWERNLLLLLLIVLLTTRTTQVDYNKVTRVDNKKETNSAYQNQNTYKTYSIDIASIVSSIDDMFVTISSQCDADDDTYSININSIVGIQFQSNMSVDNIDYDDIYDNLDDYEYPYNYVNRRDLQV